MSKKEKYEERIRRLRPIDDVFFEVLAQDPKVCEEILRVILEDPVLEVISVETQKSIRNLYGRSLRLDALCILGTGEQVNVEVQRSDQDNHLKRVRYHASCVTASVTQPGDRFENVPTVYIIYISEFDVFGLNRTIYHIQNRIEETGTAVDDGLYRIFVNAAVNDGSDIADLMKCFVQTEATDPKYPRFAERVHMLKHSEGGKQVMSSVVDEIRDEAIREGKKEGKREGKKEEALNLARKYFEQGLDMKNAKAIFKTLTEKELMEIRDSVRLVKL